MSTTTTIHENLRGASADRRPASRVALGALLSLVALFVIQQAVIFQSLVPPVGIVQAAGSLLAAVAVTRRWRRAHALGAAWCALLILGSLPMIVGDLADPGNIADFVFTLVVVPTVLTGLVAGVIDHRRGER